MLVFLVIFAGVATTASSGSGVFTEHSHAAHLLLRPGWHPALLACHFFFFAVVVAAAGGGSGVVCTGNILTDGPSCSTSSLEAWMGFRPSCLLVFLVIVVVVTSSPGDGSGGGGVHKKHSYSRALMQHILFFVLDGVLPFLYVSSSCCYCCCCCCCWRW